MKVNKILIITAVLFVVFGSVIAGAAIVMTAKSSDSNARMRTQTITENIKKVNISVDMSDIKIIPDDTDKIILTYFEDDTNRYNVTTDNGMLSVKYERFNKNKAKWYDYYLNFDFKRDHDIILKVPRNFTSDIEINSDYGDIEISGVKSDNMNIRTDYGDVDIERCTSETLKCYTDYGDIELKDCVCNIDCGTDYGDVEVERISGSSITLSTSCGDIEGTIIGNETDYTINAGTDLGDNNMQNRTGGKNTLNAKTNLGDISLNFIQ